MSHTSHMYPVYPGDLITQEKTPELLEAAEQGGWPGAWRVCLMARFHNSLECGRLLKSTGAGLGAGMLTDTHQQIDAIFGLGAGVAEMLLQSHQSFIELLPAVPVDWNQGSFSGFRARGGFEVSVSWGKCWIRQAEIRSRLGGICRVKARGLTGVSGAEGRWDGAVLSFPTQAGGSYRLEFGENVLANREYKI